MKQLAQKEKGNLTELQCLTAFYEYGYKVSIPYGDNCRYDFIVDLDGILLRIQVKTCKVTSTGIVIPCYSTSSNTGHIYTKEEIDYFATFYNGKCYLIKVEECSTSKTLYFENKKVNQHPVAYIENYSLEHQIQKIMNYEDDIILQENKIYQYDLRNNLINTFNSCRDAAKSLGDVGKNTHISQAVRGIRKTAYGYKWTDTLIKG